MIGYNELGGGYPKYPHHAAAFGKSSNAWSLYTQEKNTPGTVPFGYTLEGGLAGGPEASCSTFEDNIGNYVSSEYCSYYNAGFTGAVAYINKIENDITTSTKANLPGKSYEPIEFQIHPNPVNDQLSITGNDKVSKFEIIDNTGRVVMKINTRDSATVNVSSLNKGIYYVKPANGYTFKKFTKQ